MKAIREADLAVLAEAAEHLCAIEIPASAAG